MRVRLEFDEVVLIGGRSYPIRIALFNDSEKTYLVRPLIELEIEGKVHFLGVFEQVSLEPRGESVLEASMRAPMVDGEGAIRAVVEMGGRDVAEDSKKVGIVSSYEKRDPLKISFVWHHHQAPNFLPGGKVHDPWAYVHVIKGNFQGFKEGGPYSVHLQLHHRHPRIVDVDNLSPSLLDQWYRYGKDLEAPEELRGISEDKLKMIEEMVHGYRALIKKGRIEPLTSMYAHTIQGFIIKLFRQRGMDGLVRELIKWEWRKGIGITEEIMGIRPRGGWTPEMFWSMDLVQIYHELGIEYTVLCEQHFRVAGGDKGSIYEPYIVEDFYTGDSLVVFFRDKELSDWISFQTDFESEEEAEASAREFILALLRRYRDPNSKICVIALDGENWMIIPRYKRYSALFLDRVWGYLERLSEIFEVVTLSRALDELPPPRRLTYVPWGSWLGLSDSQWTGGGKMELWNYVVEQLRWVAAYYNIVPPKVRDRLLGDDGTPLSRAFLAAAISLDSDYYWYGDLEKYRNVVRIWAELARKISQDQISKIRVREPVNLDGITVLEVENNLDHPIELSLHTEVDGTVDRSMRIRIESHSTEPIYIPLSRRGAIAYLEAPPVTIAKIEL